MLLRIFTHSLKNSKWRSSLSIWLAGVSMTELRSASHLNNWERAFRSLWWDGRSCVHALRESAWGPKPAQTGEQGTGMLCPREQTSESLCDAVLSECESTRPLNPRTATRPRGEFAPESVQRYHSERTLAERSVDGLRSRIERSLHHSWHHKIAAVKRRFPARSPGFVLSLLFRAGCIALVSGPGHFKAMLETVPRRWNGGLHLNWGAYPRSITPSNQREILGIVFHMLKNWHSSFSGLVVGCAGECWAAITHMSSGSVPLWGGASGAVLTEWGGKSSFAQIYAL